MRRSSTRSASKLADGSILVARANICATGIEYRSLGLPEEPAFLNAGLFYGAGSSEAPMCAASRCSSSAAAGRPR